MKRVLYGGKVFTEVVSKHPLRAIIQTIDGRIEGRVHLHPENRLSDEINLDDPFLAVTEAHVSCKERTFEAAFIAVNKAHIVWVIPVEDGGEKDD